MSRSRTSTASRSGRRRCTTCRRTLALTLAPALALAIPLPQAQVHDVLQKRFADLKSIFLAYCRSIGGSGSAEDAMEMEMAEFQVRGRVRVG